MLNINQLMCCLLASALLDLTGCQSLTVLISLSVKWVV